MGGEVFHVPLPGARVIVANLPNARTVSLVATYGCGFGHDPVHAPGIAHLYEHLFLATLRTIVTVPMVAHGETHADTVRIAATAPVGAGSELVAALFTAAQALAAGVIDDDVWSRECRAIDVELSEWISNPLLVVGHRLAALATRRPQVARFDECQLGAVATLTAHDLQSHAAVAAVNRPDRLVIVGPQPAEAWLSSEGLARLSSGNACEPLGDRPMPGLELPMPGLELPMPGLDLPGAGSRVYVAVPLTAESPEHAEAACVAAMSLLHERGPLAAVGENVGIPFRAGSVVRTAGRVVVTGSWTVHNDREREAIGIAVRQHSGQPAPDLVAAEVDSLEWRRPAAARVSATLAYTIDAWQSGYGIDPTATGKPGVNAIGHIVRTGWEQSVLLGAN